MGIKFAVYAHSGNVHLGSTYGVGAYGMDLDIYHVKDADEPGTRRCESGSRRSGRTLQTSTATRFEYYRKRCDERPESDKVILYYSDGKMPAENHNEELEILQREIKICKQKGYTLLGVGVRTDSPARHGLDTVQIDDVADVSKVVRHLEKVLR